MKKILTVILSVITVGVVVCAPFLIKKKQNANTFDSLVITVWHVDAFDGGKGSRCSFLRSVSSDYSKENKGVYFLVSNYSIEGLKYALESGKHPDIISFGGCDLGVENYAREINFSVRDGGCVGKKRFAVAYLKGGYFKIIKGAGSGELIIPNGEYFSAETACLFSNAERKKVSLLEKGNAYNRFLVSSNATLIGTQRDVTRLLNANVEFTLEPIFRYNDLYQYFSVTTGDISKQAVCNSFINYVLSPTVQRKIETLNMFSVTGEKLYSDGFLSLYEKFDNEYTFIPFSTKENFETLKSKAFLGVNSGEDYDIIVNSCKNLINVVK